MHPDQAFPNTRWSVILQAQDNDSGVRDRALEQICGTYWLPIYAFARSQGLAPADAEDITQNVLIGLLDKGAFEQVAAEKGQAALLPPGRHQERPARRLAKGQAPQTWRRRDRPLARLRGEIIL